MRTKLTVAGILIALGVFIVFLSFGWSCKMDEWISENDYNTMLWINTKKALDWAETEEAKEYLAKHNYPLQPCCAFTCEQIVKAYMEYYNLTEYPHFCPPEEWFHQEPSVSYPLLMIGAFLIGIGFGIVRQKERRDEHEY